MMNRRHAMAAAAAILSLPVLMRAWAQAAWPAKPVRIVVPFGAGGVADLTARAVGEALSAKLGQAVIIENKPGAGGVGAGEVVARAEPDGYTLLLVSNGTAVSAGLFKQLPFDALKDFAPVSLIGVFDIGILVPANSPFKSLQDLLAAAKAKPGKLNVATVNVGSTQNLAAELFKSTAGVDMQVVPFNGTPAVITALRGGQVDAAVEILGPVKTQVTSGGLRVLAVMGAKRSAAFSDVPTIAESGGALVRFEASSWNGLATPAKTPVAIIERLNRDLQAVLATPALKQKLAALDVEAHGTTPQELGQILARETKRWGDVITRANIPRQ